MPVVYIHHLGRVDYQRAWDLQARLHREVVDRKLALREHRRGGGETVSPRQHHHLLFVEHPPVFTLGKSGSTDHLLLSEAELEEQGFTFLKINRGGDITYHGPGQLVAYPIFDLDEFFNDVHRYVRSLEEVVIRTLADFGLKGERDPGYTGVWLAGNPGRRQPRRKICAIGVHLSRWTTMHGFALNVRPNLTHFGHIVPCGIAEDGRSVTSLSVELGRPVELEEVTPVVERHFREVFDFVPTTAPESSILSP
ncbi:lipoyl(octanoyl) transferase [Lewinella marina]|uniref:Octanoyltransferase n=1 Tax=Neolewinella marina TaxID=438751 RepID=A0A2G0CEW8_9BACT|nr:lipoyl(octanoyl) transferase LipB [Neolewinella marina]NJB85808.1 lipoyl(octanoyl) transferase [Neolewinella marina]PHK98523.1 lipoyl(octanoyl) transferase [Neolewinella marina]